ncbi:tyrosinase family oxidase copper chaperone [Streptomyces viridiviolaceus]
MIGSMDWAPMRAEDGTPGPALPGPAGRTRRDVARGLRAFALVGALAPVLAAFRLPRPRSGSLRRGTGFDVTHAGRRIRGVRTSGSGAFEDGRWHVTVDGRPLHLMRRADGTWLSMVDHYCSYPTPLEAARAAVDALGPGVRLRAARAADRHEGGRHDVRA